MVYVIWGLAIVMLMTAIAMVTAVLPALVLRAVGLRKLSDRLIFWHMSLIARTGLRLAVMSITIARPQIT